MYNSSIAQSQVMYKKQNFAKKNLINSKLFEKRNFVKLATLCIKGHHTMTSFLQSAIMYNKQYCTKYPIFTKSSIVQKAPL